MTMTARVALPPNIRAIAYYVWSLGSLIIGATQVGYSAADVGQPTWLIVALAVWAFVGAGLGLTAATNTPLGDGTAIVAGDVIAAEGGDRG